MPGFTTRRPVRRILLRSASIAALVLGVVHGELSGQGVPAAGSRIRVSTDSIHAGRWTTGQYIALSNSVLHMVSQEGDTVNVPRLAIHHFEMSEGRYSHTRAGLIVGVIVGAGAGFLIHSVGCAENAANPAICADVGRLTATMVGAAGGGLFGGLFGTLSKTDRWARVPFERFPR